METWVVVALVLGSSAISALLTFSLMKRRVSQSVRRLEKELERARDTKEAKPKEAGVPKLDDTERTKLELEYRECSQDWRWRDRYVLQKLSAAGILFGLLGVALGTIPPGSHLIKLLLVLIGILFSLVLSISVAKDTYYRDGTEKLLRRLSAQININSSLQTLKSLEGFDDGLNFQELEFPRKISIERDKSSLKPSLMFPRGLRDWLLDQPTFRWILGFYLGSLLIFVSLFVIILFDWISGSCLPF